MSQVPCHLRCFSHMGSYWTREALWSRRSVQKPSMAVPHRSSFAGSSMDTKQDLPGKEMDRSDQYPGYLLRICRHATGHPDQHSQLDRHGDHIQLLRVQVQEDVVAEVQLRALGCIGCRDGLHGGTAVFRAPERGEEREVVGIGAGPLPVGVVPDCQGDCGPRVPCLPVKMVWGGGYRRLVQILVRW